MEWIVSQPFFFFKVVCTKGNKLVPPQTVPAGVPYYQLTLSPPVILHNYLPYNIQYSLEVSHLPYNAQFCRGNVIIYNKFLLLWLRMWWSNSVESSLFMGRPMFVDFVGHCYPRIYIPTNLYLFLFKSP
jgi:hypothetical protein